MRGKYVISHTLYCYKFCFYNSVQHHKIGNHVFAFILSMFENVTSLKEATKQAILLGYEGDEE